MNRFLLKSIALLVLVSGSTVCADLAINSPSDFVKFAMSVNDGTSYSGETVTLESDLVLKRFSVVGSGQNNDKPFQGVFDGKGHVISKAVVNSDKPVPVYAGLLRVAENAEIKNVVLDASCSFTVSNANNVYLGGIVGTCSAGSGKKCSIENVVSMANITYVNGTNDIRIGGIVGQCIDKGEGECAIKGCVNFGDINKEGYGNNPSIGGIIGYAQPRITVQDSTNYGNIYDLCGALNELYIGGIIGNGRNYGSVTGCANFGKIYSQSSDNKVSIGGISGKFWNGCGIQASLNFGEIEVSGASLNEVEIGGIIGGMTNSNGNITSCVSGGNLTLNVTNNVGQYPRLGSIGGALPSSQSGISCTITDCYSSDIIPYNATGEKLSTEYGNTVSYNKNFTLESGESLFEALDKSASESNFQKWILNTSTKGDQEVCGWCVDKECTEKVSLDEAHDVTSLYPMYCDSYQAPGEFDSSSRPEFVGVKLVFSTKSMSKEDITGEIKRIIQFVDNYRMKVIKEAEDQVYIIVEFDETSQLSEFEAMFDGDVSGSNIFDSLIDYELYTEYLVNEASTLAVALLCMLI